MRRDHMPFAKGKEPAWSPLKAEHSGLVPKQDERTPRLKADRWRERYSQGDHANVRWSQCRLSRQLLLEETCVQRCRGTRLKLRRGQAQFSAARIHGIVHREIVIP